MMIIQSLSRSINKELSLFSRLTFSEGNQSLINRKFHAITQSFLSKPTVSMHMETLNNNSHINIINNLLQPLLTPLWNQKCGLKYKAILQLRCKDCFYYWSDGRRFVRCTTHPRHRQAQTAKKPKNTWILTSVCQKKRRPWV